MREQAIQKLSKAYHLDEIACSVATMQSASPLEDVASLLLQRNPQDPDGKYVHFFHEKIPSPFAPAPRSALSRTITPAPSPTWMKPYACTGYTAPPTPSPPTSS